MTVGLDTPPTTVAPAPAGGSGRRLTVVEIVTVLVGAVFAATLLYALAGLVIEILAEGDGSPLAPYADALALPGTAKVFVDTIVVVTVATLCALVIAVGFAWLNERTNARLGFVAAFLPLIPLLVPSLASTIGWVFLAADRAGILNVMLRDLLPFAGLSDTGPLDIYSMGGMVFLYTLNIVPFIYLPVSAALSRLDPSLDEASRVAGVGPARTLFKVTIPAIRPAIAGGLLLGIAVGLATFSIGVIIGAAARIDVLAVRIYNLLTQGFPPQTAEAVALSTFLLFTVLVVSTFQRRVTARGAHATIGGKGIGSAVVDLGPGKWVARAAMIVFVALSSVVPLLGLFYISLLGSWQPSLTLDGISLDSYVVVLSDNPMTSTALRNSVLLAVVGGLVTLLAATLIAIFTAQRRGRISTLLDGLAKAPGGLSHLVLAIALLVAFTGPPFRFGTSLVILFLAFLVFFMPQAYVSASSAYAQLSRELEEASLISGAGPVRTLTRITLPLMLPGLVGGAIILFVLIMSEVTGSALLAGPDTPVVGFVMLDLWANGTFSTIAALGVVITLISTAVAMLLLWVGRTSRT
ncbi:ABC transporter permease [Pseudonocardia parietis]|uniref:Iron(III) transport system permease protein n=1 Tax=Pseudonocardia parietis TaxID=570936 RepID=A0ABS4VUT0_9PSEU|nr:iron ABC transporter permease [Pseudonocardia parietis]MBP2367678.1 iron(III) transport system permease protein [Pseudonocardia parietis]